MVGDVESVQVLTLHLRYLSGKRRAKSSEDDMFMNDVSYHYDSQFRCISSSKYRFVQEFLDLFDWNGLMVF